MSEAKTWSVGPYELAESPTWDEERNCLWWVDILDGALLQQDARAQTPRVYRLDGQFLSAIGLCDDGSLVVGTTNGLTRFTPESEKFEPLFSIEAEAKLGNRMNDGKVGPDGAFYLGSMHLSGAGDNGSLYRFDSNGLSRRVLSGLGISNGIDWSLDGELMYHIDTGSQTLSTYRDFANAEPSLISVTELSEFPGFPDGISVDRDGAIWVCFWAGAAIRRFSPLGELLREIELPVLNPTSCIFGGEDLATLFITTGAYGLDEADRARQPQSGSVLALDVSVSGPPARRFTWADHQN